MAIEIVPYTTEWEPAVARFNQRMREGKAPSAFDLPPRAGTPKSGVVHTQHYIAIEATEVRGGILVLEHPAFINNATQDGGSARRETVINLQSPLSEGIINPRYAMVSIQLIRFALKRCPYAYVVGMGGMQHPLPRLLKASGWTVRPVPFFFHVLRAARSLTQLTPLKRSAPLRAAALVGAYTGGGALALSVVQRPRVSTRGYRVEPVSGSDANSQQRDDAIWSAVEGRLSFGVVRNSETLDQYLWPQVQRHRVFVGDSHRGWFTIMVSSMRNHSYFGNLRVATIVDLVAEQASDLAPLARLAVAQARTAGCDLVVSNQLHAESQAALRRAGFIAFSSNYLFASSKLLSAAIVDATSMVSRQDGDGLVNLRGARPEAG